MRGKLPARPQAADTLELEIKDGRALKQLRQRL